LVLSSLAALAIPQSPVVTYGLVRDEYGNPIKRSSALSAKLVKADAPDGFVYASTTVGETAYPDMNYRLQLEIDSEGPTRSYAVLEGTEMRIRFFIGDEEQPATPTPVFTTPANGTAQRKDYALGTDADGDGLPDAWEAWVLSAGGNASDAAAIAAFAPGADADGDGMSNYREFLAGTDPFISTDLLEITRFVKTGSGDRTEIRFTTVPGRSYRVVSTATLEDPVWTPVATSRNAEGEAAYETYSGTGRQITVYIDTPGTDSAFFRVAAQ
jgi:hypothetical protein